MIASEFVTNKCSSPIELYTEYAALYAQHITRMTMDTVPSECIEVFSKMINIITNMRECQRPKALFVCVSQTAHSATKPAAAASNRNNVAFTVGIRVKCRNEYASTWGIFIENKAVGQS